MNDPHAQGSEAVARDTTRGFVAGMRTLRRSDWARILGYSAILWLAGRGLTDVVSDVAGWRS